MVAARPRRSNAAQSFKIQFPDISGSEAEVSSSGDDQKDEQQHDGEGDEAGVEVTKKDKGKERAVEEVEDADAGDEAAVSARSNVADDNEDEDDIESQSGSEYAPDQDRGNKLFKHDDHESIDSADLEEGDPEEPDDGPSDAGEVDIDQGSDIVEVTAPQAGPSSSLQGLKHGTAKPVSFFSGFAPGSLAEVRMNDDGSLNKPAMQILGREATAQFLSSGDTRKKSVPKRKAINIQHVSKKTPAYDVSYGPSFWPPTLSLTRAFDDLCHCPRHPIGTKPNEIGLKDDAPRSNPQRTYAIRRVSYLPVGPHWGAIDDLSWYKDKYIRVGDTREIQRAGRWGINALESKIQVDRYRPLSIEQAARHFPRNVYGNAPATVHTEKPAETAEEAEMAMADGINENTLMAEDPSTTAEASSNETDDPFARFWIGLFGELAVSDDFVGTQIDQQQRVEMPRFSCVRLDSYLPCKPGYILNAGGPVTGLDWMPQSDNDKPPDCEYLAVGTASDQVAMAYRTASTSNPGLLQIWSMDTSIASDFGVETSADRKGKGMTFELGIALGSEIIMLKWAPQGGRTRTPSAVRAKPNEAAQGEQGSATNGSMNCMDDNTSMFPRLGMIAIVTSSGCVMILDVPNPNAAKSAYQHPVGGTLFLHPLIKPLQLEVGDMAAACVDWISHTRIVVGLQTGAIAVFDVLDALLGGADRVEPLAYVVMHDSPITAVAAVREPPLDLAGRPKHDADPTRIVTSSVDGSSRMVDLLDPGIVFSFGHERTVRSTACYQPYLGGCYYNDQEMGVRLLSLRLRDLGASTRMNAVNGPIMDCAASDYHPFIATASGDGTAGIANSMRRMKRGAHVHHLYNKAFKLDFSRKTGEFRFSDNIIPDRRVNTDMRGARPPTAGPGKKKRKKQGADGDVEDEVFELTADMLASASWPMHVAVTRVAWCKSIRKAHLLASGMACGLVRIDMMDSEWSGEASAGLSAPQASTQGIGSDSDD